DEEGIEAWTVDDGRTDEDLLAASREVTDGGEPADGTDPSAADDGDFAVAADDGGTDQGDAH
ncbi:hypothetical protein BRC73_07150, partial [Halobacteriales archaeon QH_7_66_37]